MNFYWLIRLFQNFLKINDINFKFLKLINLIL